MPIEHRPKIANALQSVLDSYHLSDVWRRLHPHDKKISWQRNNPNNINGVFMYPSTQFPPYTRVLFYLAHSLITPLFL